jgi:hypothetical protein
MRNWILASLCAFQLDRASAKSHEHKMFSSSADDDEIFNRLGNPELVYFDGKKTINELMQTEGPFTQELF